MRALVTRPRENAGSIAKILAERDIEVLLEPLLDIRPIEHKPIDLDGVQAILVTSPAGARALADAVSRRDLPVYAVGDATADILRDNGFEKVESARGDGEALATLVLERLSPKDGPLLYASGRTVAVDLTERLGTAGFEVRRVELYAARPAAALSDVTVNALREDRLDFALFFSPRTAQTFTRLVQEAGVAEHCARIRAFCLSQNVADSIKEVSWAGVEVAEKPEQMALVDRIDAHISSLTEKPAEAEEAPSTAEPAPRPTPPAAPPPRPASRIPAFAAIALAALAIIAVALLWQNQQDLESRLAAASAPASQALADLRQRTDDMAGTIGRLESRIEQAASNDSQAIESRLAELESSVEAQAKKFEEGLQALRSETATALQQLSENQAVTDSLQAINQRVDELAGRLDESARTVGEEIETLRAAVAQAQKTADEAAGTTSAAALLALGQVEAAVEAGRPFAEPLSKLRRLVDELPGGDDALAGWSQSAEAGIPTLPVLKERFEELVVEAGSQIESGTGPAWLAEAMERAASIVSIRRVGEDVEGDSPDAVLARAEAALDRGDLRLAVEEVETLQGKPAELFAGWLEDARARLAATEGLVRLENLVITAAGGRG